MKDFFFNSEANQLLQQPPQGHGRDPIAGGLQDATGQGARQPHPGSPPQAKLDRVIFSGPFQPGLFCDSMYAQTNLKPKSLRKH